MKSESNLINTQEGHGSLKTYIIGFVLSIILTLVSFLLVVEDVLSGKLFIDLEGRTIELEPMTGTTIPKGIMHKTRAIEKTVMLMVETININPLGN